MTDTAPPIQLAFRPEDVGAQVLTNGNVQMNLRDEMGNEIFVELKEPLARALGFELVLTDAKAHASTENPQPDVPFDTEHAATVLMGGNNSGGHVIMRFLTPAGVWLTTAVGPRLAAMLANNLNSSLAQMPKPPEEWMYLGPLVVPLKGKTKSKDIISYFGQNYPREIVEIFGVLMIRANLLETALIFLLSFVSGLKLEIARALFFSSQNNKARLDTIRNISSASSLAPGIKDWVEKCLDRSQSLANQRNLLVHGEWEFKSDKFSVKERKAVIGANSQDPIVSYKSLNDLASKFNDLAGEIESRIISESFMAQHAATSASESDSKSDSS